MNNQDEVIIGEGGKLLLAMADKMASMKKAINVARQVKAKLKELGWTNKQLAEAMGCSQPMVTKIVRGDQNLTLETISKLERVLGIKEIYLHKQEQPDVTISDAKPFSFNTWGQYSEDIPIMRGQISSFQNLNAISYGRQQALA